MLGKLSLSSSAQINFPFIRCTVLPFESSLYKLLTDHFPLCFPVHLPHYVLILFSPPLFLIRGECGDSNCEVWHDLCKLVCLSKLEMRHKEVLPSWIELTVNHGSKKSLSLKNQSSAILIQEIRLRKVVKSMEFPLHWDCREQTQYQQRMTAVWKGSLIAQLCLMYSTSDYK